MMELFFTSGKDNTALSYQARFPLILTFSPGEKGILYPAFRQFIVH
jgi:hypothetical protein